MAFLLELRTYHEKPKTWKTIHTMNMDIVLTKGRKFFWNHRTYTISAACEFSYLDPPMISIITKTKESFVFRSDKFHQEIDLLPKFRKGDLVQYLKQLGTVLKVPDINHEGITYTIKVGNREIKCNESEMSLVKRDLRYGRPILLD